MQRKGKGEHTTRFICLAWQNLGHLTPPDIYQPFCCRDTPQTCHPSPNWGSWGREAGCSWMLNKPRASRGSLSPSSNHIWFLFPQLTHPLRCIPLCWISQIARFKGKKKLVHTITLDLKTVVLERSGAGGPEPKPAFGDALRDKNKLLSNCWERRI